MTQHLLNRPLQLLDGSVLRNRLAKAAMSETLGTYDNRPTPSLVRLCERWGASGLGLIVTGKPRAFGRPLPRVHGGPLRDST